jgi:predicted TIM-barrel fold metal-dependent hydrolase
MKRIRFLSALLGAAALLATGAPSLALAADHYTGPVIDTHAHLRLTDDDGALPNHPKGIAPLRALDQAANVQLSALIVIAQKGDMAATRAQNDAAIAAAASDPQHFYPIASVHPADGDAALVELERLAKLGVKVIKLHPNSQKFDVGDPAVAKVTDKCGALGMAVLFDSYSPTDGDEIGKLMMLSFYQPKTQFIFAHMGFSHFREVHTLVVMRKLGYGHNVWLDISAIVPAYVGSPVQPELVWTLRQHGFDHVLFGSDWPVDTPEAGVAAVRALGLTADEERLVLHDSAATLLGLK